MSCKLGLQIALSLFAITFVLAGDANSQIVRRYPGGGLTVRAPFVRVDVGAYGGTSVRAPFVAVDPGAVQVGPRRRLLRRQIRAERRALEQTEQSQSFGQVQAEPPTLAETPPLPSPAELEALELTELVSALRDLSRILHDSLEKFDDPTGWQRYLEIPDTALGSPGIEEVAIDLSALEKKLDRFRNVANDAEFAKISKLQPFKATLFTLELVVDRFTQAGPILGDPDGSQRQQDPGPVTAPDDSSELLVPPSPEPRSGERSILKRR